MTTTPFSIETGRLVVPVDQEDHVLGPPSADVTLVEYGDYQCPFCVRVHGSLDEVAKTYPKDVRIVYKMHPLAMHQQAGIAARGALAAQKQGKFFEMHKKLFENSSSLSPDKVNELAKSIGLDMDRFEQARRSPPGAKPGQLPFQGRNRSMHTAGDFRQVHVSSQNFRLAGRASVSSPGSGRRDQLSLTTVARPLPFKISTNAPDCRIEKTTTGM